MEVAKGAEWCGGRFEETPFRKDREVEKSRSESRKRQDRRTAGPGRAQGLAKRDVFRTAEVVQSGSSRKEEPQALEKELEE